MKRRRTLVLAVIFAATFGLGIGIASTFSPQALAGPNTCGSRC
jgi:hypothetical protein